jgi:hypothetical protein
MDPNVEKAINEINLQLHQFIAAEEHRKSARNIDIR